MLFDGSAIGVFGDDSAESTAESTASCVGFDIEVAFCGGIDIRRVCDSSGLLCAEGLYCGTSVMEADRWWNDCLKLSFDAAYGLCGV